MSAAWAIGQGETREGMGWKGSATVLLAVFVTKGGCERDLGPGRGFSGAPYVQNELTFICEGS